MTAAHVCLSLVNAVDIEDIASFLSAFQAFQPFSLAFNSAFPLQLDTPRALARQTPLSRRQLVTFLKRRFNTADLRQPQ
jgi:hypothetical protein